MNWMFLEAGAIGLEGIFAAFLGLLIFVMVLSLLIWFYIAFALMKIAKKTNTPRGWFAFIPYLNLYLMSRIAKMRWWPVLLIVAYFVFSSLIYLGGFIGIIGMILGTIAIWILIVYVFIWQWKIFEAVERPGWWILLVLIPVAGPFIYLVVLGMAAWGHPENHIELI